MNIQSEKTGNIETCRSEQRINRNSKSKMLKESDIFGRCVVIFIFIFKTQVKSEKTGNAFTLPAPVVAPKFESSPAIFCFFHTVRRVVSECQTRTV